ncbi:MAG: FKBP-type peptidyl-prolyl cis-trans isomerase [Anaeromyxobacteraceae bacterium]|nr:FKBP-type peptidyl-prolyl cis-trans isomerase [Anaeromyxobacteraceae bacterium]
MRSFTAVAAASLLLAGAARAEEKRPAQPAAPAAASAAPAGAELEKALYAVGLSVARSLEPFSLTEAELATVQKGVKDGVAGKPAFALDDKAQRDVQGLVQQRLAATAEKEKVRGEEFLKKAAAEKGAVKTASGLVYTSLKEGTGQQPAAADKVKVHYTGTFIDGKVFDSSVSRGQPIDFPLGGVIGCWTEGVQKMKVGGKARLVCPSAIAYGPSGRPPQIPGNAVLVFEVELLGVEAAKAPAAPAPAAPAAPAAPKK